MTPEEKAVIQAAIEWRRAIPGRSRDIRLGLALEEKIWDLITRCNECNYDRHTCPGCGKPIGHGDSDCGKDCTDSGTMTPEQRAEREQLRRQLEEIGQGVMQEWMRIVDLTDVAGIDFQARVSWQNDNGECIVGERPHSDEYGRFVLRVTATDLGPIPPIGPENDPAQQYERFEEPTFVNGIEVAALAEDVARREAEAKARHAEPLWVERTWADVRKGDRVRMPGSGVEAVIADRLWHPSEDPAGKSWRVVQSAESGPYAHTGDRVVQPGECVIVSPDIQGSERGRHMNPAAPVEILVPGGQVTLDAMAVLAEELGQDAWKLRAGFSHEVSSVTAPNPSAVDCG